MEIRSFTAPPSLYPVCLSSICPFSYNISPSLSVSLTSHTPQLLGFIISAVQGLFCMQISSVACQLLLLHLSECNPNSTMGPIFFFASLCLLPTVTFQACYQSTGVGVDKFLVANLSNQLKKTGRKCFPVALCMGCVPVTLVLVISAVQT